MRVFSRGESRTPGTEAPAPHRFVDGVLMTARKPPTASEPVVLVAADRRGREHRVYLTHADVNAIAQVAAGGKDVTTFDGKFRQQPTGYATQPAAYNATMLEDRGPSPGLKVLSRLLQPGVARVDVSVKGMVEATLREHGLLPDPEPVTVDPFADDRFTLSLLQVQIADLQEQHAKLTADLERRVQGAEAATNPDWS